MTSGAVGSRLAALVYALALHCATSSSGHAQVSTDGSLGSRQRLTGPNILIPADLGRQLGGNLFHSFRDFNVATGESATFTGPSTISNVIGRVTGGQASHIDGILHSEIAGADLYLINPAGILFGPNAALDVSGSFHASTADYLRLADGGRFDARDPANSVLSTAPPSAFGFLGRGTASISVGGANLSVPRGQALSLVGGSVAITDNSGVEALEGHLSIMSVASTGELPLPHLGNQASGTVEYGDITVRDGSILDASGDNAGRIAIRGERFVMQGESSIVADTYGTRSGDIRIDASDVSIEGSFVRARTFDPAPADGGSVTVNAKRFSLLQGGQISGSSFGDGRGGTLTVRATETLSILGPMTGDDPSALFSVALGTGHGGRIVIAAPVVNLDGGFVEAGTLGTGRAGDIVLNADRLTIRRDDSGHRGRIVAGAFGEDAKGSGGNIAISAATIDIDGGFISTSSEEGALGPAGSINIDADRVSLTRGGLITTETTGSKVAGTLTLHANEAISIVGTDRGVVSGLYSTSTGDGDGGPVVVSAPLLSVRGGVVDTGTGGKGRGGNIMVDAGTLFLGIDDSGRPGRIIAPAYGKGATSHGGDIIINASRAILDGGFISTSSEEGASGDAGNIRVQADLVRLTNGGLIRSESTDAGNAGNITILARGVLRADDGSITTHADNAVGGNIGIDARSVQLFGSRITASVARGAGGGGNVTINSRSFAALPGSSITARADQGFGGDIFINAGVFLRSEDVRLDASSNVVGNSGLVQINTPALNISGDVAELPASFLDVSALLTKRCGVRAHSKASTFVVVGRGAHALDPDAPVWEPYGEVLQTGGASAASKVYALPKAVSSGECGE